MIFSDNLCSSQQRKFIKKNYFILVLFPQIVSFVYNVFVLCTKRTKKFDMQADANPKASIR